MLKVNGLKVNYGSIEAVKGVDFEVKENDIVTLIGANGAGKSTILKTVAGLIKPAEGKIEFMGEDITGFETSNIISRGITLVPEGRRVFPDMTVLENIKIGAYLRKDSLSNDIEWIYSLFPRLKERHWQHAGTLSGGEQQRVSVARALVNYPSVVFADEPSGNLDSESAEKLHQLFFQLRNEFRQTFVIVTHNEELATMADRKLVMVDGRIIIPNSFPN